MITDTTHDVDPPEEHPAEERHPERSDELPPEITNAMIERRAFEIWLTRGGSAEENWLQAERELLQEYGRRS